MRVKWTKKALASLEKETEYIRKNNIQASQKVVSHIKNSVKGLSDNPYMGRECVYETRELINPSYPFIVWYEVTKDSVNILLVKHMASNFDYEYKLGFIENTDD
ncbi:MAG: type II toxin-antitoxin system RelE/ParE family toxin [Magnetococcales bacterium]|nr:type II toxin-antitoxin system RelE/ParE family toxin [Magnetococcales bacterium]